MNIRSKIIETKDLARKLADFREAGKVVVFTNGCFDILHVGHVRYLAAARSEGDLLVVGLNSDESVRLIKGEKRPVVCQDHRAEILASLWCVDYVILFNQPDPLKIIQTLKPNVVVKGEDWQEEDIIGADFVKAHGGWVVRIPFVPDVSTSQIIWQIVERYG